MECSRWRPVGAARRGRRALPWVRAWRACADVACVGGHGAGRGRGRRPRRAAPTGRHREHSMDYFMRPNAIVAHLHTLRKARLDKTAFCNRVHPANREDGTPFTSRSVMRYRIELVWTFFIRRVVLPRDRFLQRPEKLFRLIISSSVDHDNGRLRKRRNTLCPMSIVRPRSRRSAISRLHRPS